MKDKILLVLLGACTIWLSTLYAIEPLKPFPQAENLEYYSIKPDRSQKQLNSAVMDFYDYWKEKYLVESSKVPGDYKVAFNKKSWTVSEAKGYGMLIVVQISVDKAKAKEYFDGLNRFRKRYPSQNNKAFMNWQVRDETTTKADSSATDGDLDMAIALLMASQQWGEKSYFEEAIDILENIETDLIRKDYSLRLVDWNKDGDKYEGSRPSDFTTAYFRVFYEATGNKLWKKVEDKCYTILEQLQREYAPNTGLIPDFAVWDEEGNWKPAQPYFLEGKNDGTYNYNASRIPWRIGVSSIYYEEPRAQKIIDRLMYWVVKKHPNSEIFKAGYTLDGKALVEYNLPLFTAPIIVAAMSTNYQNWLDEAFDYISECKTDYFSDSITLLCLLVISGNYWLPEYKSATEPEEIPYIHKPFW